MWCHVKTLVKLGIIFNDSYEKVAVRDISRVCSLGFTCVSFSQLEMVWLDVFSVLLAEQPTPRFCTKLAWATSNDSKIIICL